MEPDELINTDLEDINGLLPIIETSFRINMISKWQSSQQMRVAPVSYNGSAIKQAIPFNLTSFPQLNCVI